MPVSSPARRSDAAPTANAQRGRVWRNPQRSSATLDALDALDLELAELLGEPVARRGRVWRTPVAPEARRGRVWRTPVSPEARRGRVWRTPVSPEARRGRVWRTPVHPEVESRAGRVWATLVAIALAAAIVLGGAFVSRIDDGPRIEAMPVLAGSSSEQVSLSTIAEQVGATAAWAQGYTGEGVRIALLDTGVAPVPALKDAVVATVDVSSEYADPELRFVDGHGHGTHLAGIIAGRDDSTGFRGLAPGADIVSVKVAGADGSVTPSSVVTGIEWAIANADELGIRIITLALDTNDQSDYRTSELAAAVERAWSAGIVVVTAAGNDGADASGLSLPASDPFVIAVAGLEGDENGFTAPEWATAGDGIRNPDLAVPSAHVVSLRAPGSDADRNHRETGYVDDELFKGSGSSQGAAALAAQAALLLEARPELTPDQVKSAFLASAQPVGIADELAGAGLSRVDLALAQPVEAEVQTHERAAGPAVDRAAGAVAVPTWAGSAWAGSAWAGSAWAGSAWAGSAWAGSAWA